MTTVVTGAAGLTGGEIVRQLIARGEDVIGVVRNAEQAAAVPEGARAVVVDLADPTLLGPVLAGASRLIHVAGIHLGGAIAATGQIGRLQHAVAVSTAGVHSRHRSSVEVYLAGEQTLRAELPAMAFIRPTMIYGSPRDRNVHHVVEFARRFRALPLIGAGAALLQPIHYADLAEATIALLDAPGVTVEAGGGQPISLRDAALSIFAAIGATPRFIPVPLGLALTAAAAMDRMRGGRLQEQVARTTEDRSVDNTALLSFTGVHPRSFAEGVADEVRSMRAEVRDR